jgi:RecA/RadA recombinase
VIAQIDEAYGSGTVAQGSRGRSFVLKRFMMMMFDVDLACGGGIPWGKFIHVYGPPSGGKSVLMQKMIAGAQQHCRYCRERFVVNENGEEFCSCPTHCPDCDKAYQRTEYDGPPAQEDDPFDWSVIHDEWACGCMVQPKGTRAKKDRTPKVTRRSSRVRAALFDAENSFDVKWAAFLGVMPEFLFVFLPEYAEQGIDIADKLLRSCEIDILAVDSIAELVPNKEIESSTEEWQMGLQARLVNKGLRKWNGSLNAMGTDTHMKPTIILINQTRDNITGYEEICPGGRAQIFKASIRIRVNPAKYQFKEYGTGQNKVKELQYADMSGFTKKNKTYPPMKTFSSRLYLADMGDAFAGSTNEVGVVVDRAIEFEVIARPDKTTYTFEDEAHKYTWKSQKAIRHDLSKDYSLFWAVRTAAMEKAVATIR